MLGVVCQLLSFVVRMIIWHLSPVWGFSVSGLCRRIVSNSISAGTVDALSCFYFLYSESIFSTRLQCFCDPILILVNPEGMMHL